MMLLSLGDRLARWLRTASPDRWVAILLLAAGLGSRLLCLSDRVLWYDEAFAILLARTSPAEIVRAALGSAAGTAADVHPPLYYFLLWGWTQLLGHSVATARLLSALAGLAAVAASGVLAGEMFGPRAGWTAAALIGLAPFQVHYAREARMYALLTALLLVATIAAWRGYRHSERWRHWVLLGLFSALAMYTHILSAFYLASLFTLLFLKGGPSVRKRALAGGMIGALLYLPWLIHLPGQIARVSEGYWVPRPGLQELLQTLVAFFAGMPLTGLALPAGLFGALLVVGLGVLLILRHARAGRKIPEAFLWAIALAGGPVILLFAISQWKPAYIHRGLLPSASVALVLCAWLLTTEKIARAGRGLVGLGIAIAFAAGLVSDLTYRGFPYAPFPEVDAYVAEKLVGRDIVLHSNKLTAIPAIYYDPSLPHRFLADPQGSGSDTLALPTQAVLGIQEAESPEEAVLGAEHVFFVVFDRELEEYARLSDGHHPHLDWLQRHYALLEKTRWDDLLLYEFAKSPAPAAGVDGSASPASASSGRRPASLPIGRGG